MKKEELKNNTENLSSQNEILDWIWFRLRWKEVELNKFSKSLRSVQFQLLEGTESVKKKILNFEANSIQEQAGNFRIGY